MLGPISKSNWAIRFLLSFLVEVVPLVGCGVSYVSFSDAEKVGDRFFDALRRDDLSGEMRQYSSEFTSSSAWSVWEKYLRKQPSAFGPVVSYATVSRSFAPRSGKQVTGKSEICFVMSYRVIHAKVTVYETLTMCPDPADNALRIVGHSVQRADNPNSRVTAGLTFSELGVGVGP